MNFADSIKQAHDTKWSYVNTFGVYFQFPDKLLEAANWRNFNNEKIQLNIISIDTPQFTNTPIEVFVANKWVIHNGRDELYRFTITFRDADQLDLYGKFLKMYHASKEQYFDDAKCYVGIFKDEDWIGEIPNKPIIDFGSALIENVSQVQFSNNTENQIVEFSVGFKAPVANIY